MNDIRHLCSTLSSASPGQHLDEILALFHACPPQHRLSSVSLIGQSISCMSMDQFDAKIIHHPLFLLIREWSARLLQVWLTHGALNGDEYRAIFYIYQLFKLLSEWFVEQEQSTVGSKDQQLMRQTMVHLFIEEDFIRTLCQVIHQLMNQEADEQSSTATSRLSDDPDHVSPDDIQLETQTSDVQAEQTDVLDIMFRYVNALVSLFTHSTFVTTTLVQNYVTPCISHCLHSSLFIAVATESLRQNIKTDRVPVRSTFLLFTCLDYCASSTVTSNTLQLLPAIHQLLSLWCEIPPEPDEALSPLIARLVHLIHRLALFDSEVIVREGLCAYLAARFQILCQTPSVVDDLVPLIVTVGSTPLGKQHLRRLDFVSHTLNEIKYIRPLWHPLSVLIVQHDLWQSSILKRLSHLIRQRTIGVLQSLTTASIDTSFESLFPLPSKSALATAIEWFALLRTSFLSFTMIIEELLDSTKKNNVLHLFVDTILSLEHDDDLLGTLMDIMIELLWTFALAPSTAAHEQLKKRADLMRWLKANLADSMPNVRLVSQAILLVLDSKSRSLNRGTLTRQSSFANPILICMFVTDESTSPLCFDLRDRLRLETDCSIEVIVTSACQSIDSLIHLLHRSLLVLFCATASMKFDNRTRFIHHCASNQLHPVPLLAVLLEHDCDLDGHWLADLPLLDTQSVAKQLRRYLNPHDTKHVRLPTRVNSLSFARSHRDDQWSDEASRHSGSYVERSVSSWSSDDVSQWCESTRGSFETLQPLVMRLNGPALVHLAEILSIEPASMYHSLNDELLQRTGASVPLTEYVALRSELQRLLGSTGTLKPFSPSLIDSDYERKRLKNSRLCTLL